METGFGNSIARQMKLKQDATSQIFPPLKSGSKTGGFSRPSETKCGCGGHCCKKRWRPLSSAGSCRSGYSERSYGSYCSSCDSGCVGCRSSPTHFCSCCRCTSSTSLPAPPGLTSFTPSKCFTSSPQATCCCCHHNRGRWGQRHGHVHIPESIAEEMEGELEGEWREGGAAGKKRKCRKRGKKCSDDLPKIHATGNHMGIATKSLRPFHGPSARKGISPMHGTDKHQWVNKLTEGEKTSIQLAPHQKPPIKEHAWPYATHLKDMFNKYFKDKCPPEYAALLRASANPVGRKPTPMSKTRKTTPLELTSLNMNHEDYFRQRFNRENMPGPMFTKCPREGLWFVVHPDFRREPGMGRSLNCGAGVEV